MNEKKRDLMNRVANVLPISEYVRIAKAFDEMPDDKFDAMMKQTEEFARNNPISAKEYQNILRKVRNGYSVTPENSASNLVPPVSFFSKEQACYWWNKINGSKPSDSIYVTDKDDKALCDLWKKHSSVEKGTVPSDIFFSGNVPLLDCMITVDERNAGNSIFTVEVVVFEDYVEQIQIADDNSMITVGAVVTQNHGGGRFYNMFAVQKGADCILYGPCSVEGKFDPITSVSRRQIDEAMYSALETWYGIQIALLHPTVKEVFKNPKQEIVFDPTTRSQPKNRRRITRYIKKHIINAEDIQKANTIIGRNFTRHTLAWYVIGHWRTYKDGRKVFVKPCWKGPLRDLKRNFDDREREIVLSET